MTSLIGKQATEMRQRGKPSLISDKELFATQGSWCFQVSEVSPGDLNSQIELLLQGTTDDLAVWKELASRYRAEVFCGVFLSSYNEGLSLLPKTLTLLAERGLTLDLDLYSDPSD